MIWYWSGLYQNKNRWTVMWGHTVTSAHAHTFCIDEKLHCYPIELNNSGVFLSKVTYLSSWAVELSSRLSIVRWVRWTNNNSTTEDIVVFIRFGLRKAAQKRRGAHVCCVLYLFNKSHEIIGFECSNNLVLDWWCAQHSTESTTALQCTFVSTFRACTQIH